MKTFSSFWIAKGAGLIYKIDFPFNADACHSIYCPRSILTESTAYFRKHKCENRWICHLSDNSQVVTGDCLSCAQLCKQCADTEQYTHYCHSYVKKPTIWNIVLVHHDTSICLLLSITVTYFSADIHIPMDPIAANVQELLQKMGPAWLTKAFHAAGGFIDWGF